MAALIQTPHGPVEIRPGQETDAQAYRSLRLQALRDHPEAFSADLAAIEAQLMTYWGERLRLLGSEGMLYFAGSDEELIGMCGIYRGNKPKTQHSATIVSVYVRPEWRGQRIAGGLISACVGWAQIHGIRVIKLAVVTANAEAIRCYERCGFTAYGVEPQAIYYDGVLYDELLMARSV